MAKTKQRKFVIRLVSASRAPLVRRFHFAHAGDYCYIAPGEEPDSRASRREFGGIFLLKKYRGLGLAKHLGMAAICEHFIWDSSGDRMIAHVHEENMSPRRLLTEELGFKQVGQETAGL